MIVPLAIGAVMVVKYQEQLLSCGLGVASVLGQEGICNFIDSLVSNQYWPVPTVSVQCVAVSHVGLSVRRASALSLCE
jgi:hypothetical protein